MAVNRDAKEGNMSDREHPNTKALESIALSLRIFSAVMAGWFVVFMIKIMKGIL